MTALGGARPGERLRMGLRIAAVVLAYVGYRAAGDARATPAFYLAVGAVLLTFAIIDRFTLRRGASVSLVATAQVVGGLALVTVGLLGLV